MLPHNKHEQEIFVLKAALIARLPDLVEGLFGEHNVRRTGHDFRIGTHGSLSVRATDGNYFNHETGDGGDVLGLIQHVLRIDFWNALTWARKFMGQHHLNTTHLHQASPPRA